VTDVFEILKERGFVAQATDVGELKGCLSKPSSCYIGFDPTAESLHVGSLVPIMALAHMQRAGHRPIVLVGGGTGLVGDPSGKTEMRQMLTLEQIESNVDSLRTQLSRFLDFSEGKALLVNNADWLLELRYIEFLRDIGKHFSVNRMLAAESYKIRMETGLNFIEFNYMLLQAYDFYHLAKTYDCYLQMGGDDQWGNIVAGIDLVRKKLQKPAHCITFPLLTTASGAKMGKTAAGAVWLSSGRTSPFDFYQFWINTDDRDVEKFLKLYTFLPSEEIAAVASLGGRDLNVCKSILAFEVTKLVHGRDAAFSAIEAASSVFGERRIAPDLLASSDIPRVSGEKADAVPTTIFAKNRLQTGIAAFELFDEIGLCDSKSAARRLIQQGGAYVNEDRIKEFDFLISDLHLKEGALLLKAGKKKVHRIKVD
jgi:tyrosyl-tRNA synthetase